MENKKVLVTGSTGGIGLAIARKFAEGGASVALHGLADPDGLKALADEFKERLGVSFFTSGEDLVANGGVDALCEKLSRDFGDVDILVNNAGMQRIAPVEELGDSVWRDVLHLNLTVPFMLTKRLLPAMLAKGWGRVINMASVHGLVASVNKSAYVSSKHGLVGLTKSLALECAGRGVTANAICPGWVETDLIRKQYEAIAEKDGVSLEEAKSRLLFEKQPSGRFVLPEQVAELAWFLCSEAASQITGTTHAIDGGWVSR